MSESFTTSLLMDLASWSVDLVGSQSLRESDSVSRDTEKRWSVMIVSGPVCHLQLLRGFV